MQVVQFMFDNRNSNLNFDFLAVTISNAAVLKQLFKKHYVLDEHKRKKQIINIVEVPHIEHGFSEDTLLALLHVFTVKYADDNRVIRHLPMKRIDIIKCIEKFLKEKQKEKEYLGQKAEDIYHWMLATEMIEPIDGENYLPALTCFR